MNNKWLQAKYTFFVSAIVGFFIIAISIGLYYAIRAELFYRLPDVAEQSLIAAVILSAVKGYLLFWLPIILIVVVLISVIFSRRIALPQRRLLKNLQALSQGDFATAAEHRPGEELKNLVKLINETRENLAKLVNE
ncbi:unnamed protein product, partial [marine sediment metagenome]